MTKVSFLSVNLSLIIVIFTSIKLSFEGKSNMSIKVIKSSSAVIKGRRHVKQLANILVCNALQKVLHNNFGRRKRSQLA